MKIEEKISCPEGRIIIEGSMLRQSVSLLLLSVLSVISSTGNPPGDESQQDKPVQKPLAERIGHYDINKAHAVTYVPSLRLQKGYDVAGTDHVTYSLRTSRSVTRTSGKK